MWPPSLHSNPLPRPPPPTSLFVPTPTNTPIPFPPTSPGMKSKVVNSPGSCCMAKIILCTCRGGRCMGGGGSSDGEGVRKVDRLDDCVWDAQCLAAGVSCTPYAYSYSYQTPFSYSYSYLVTPAVRARVRLGTPSLSSSDDVLMCARARLGSHAACGFML